ncbi:MAG: twin-arginine translocation signal domain-containing protein [Deltaproteobacteria bacterium]|nr:twin-arginine translocation signal domain-containing protein [Deltaproteobacteria bacterium]
MADHPKWTRINRRDFFKATALAGAAVAMPALPATSFAMQNAATLGGVKPSPAGNKRTLLFVSDAPERFEKMIDSIKSIREYEIQVLPVKIDIKKPEDILKSIEEKNADIIFMILPGLFMSSRYIAEAIGTLDIPVILLPINNMLIMWETDLAAAFRIKGANALVANSEDHALELIKIVSVPRPLEGQKALIFSKPFGSTSIPSPNLNEDYIYKMTGVRVMHRPVDDLKELIKGIDETAAKKEMEKWKKGAAKIVDATDEMLFGNARMYLLLRSLIEKEGLSAVSIDCLKFSFGADDSIPLPCLAFTMLRDQGITAACEADVCMMLTSMLLQEVSGRPSFQSNVSSVDLQNSTTVLRHCVAPTKIYGPDAPPVPYYLRDYHGMGKGAVPEIEYPVGLDVTIGGYSKDLKDFIIWPGRIVQGVNDKATPSFKDAPPEYQKMRKYCSNRAEIKVKDIHGFMKNIVGIHHNMIAGSYGKAIADSLIRMNVDAITPPDLIAPEA